MTSNLSLGEIAAYNPRIASRLASFVAVEMVGRDRRKDPKTPQGATGPKPEGGAL